MQAKEQDDETMSDELSEDYWNELSNAIDLIFKKKAENLSFQELY